MRPRRALALTAFVFLGVGACGGRATSPGAGGSDDAGTGTRSGTQEPCPNVDYCALRCSPDLPEIPLYPPHCNLPTCPCLVGVKARNDWSGTYTLTHSVDAVNLTLEPDGTFHWTLDGCDSFSGDCGEWRKSQPHVVTLMPSAGRTSFAWPSGAGIDDRQRLLVTNPDDRAIAVEHPEPGEKPTADRWDPGHLCASCSGTAIAKTACTTPVARRCR